MMKRLIWNLFLYKSEQLRLSSRLREKYCGLQIVEKQLREAVLKHELIYVEPCRKCRLALLHSLKMMLKPSMYLAV